MSTSSPGAVEASATHSSSERLAAVAAIAAGVVGFIYSASFVLRPIDTLRGACLLLTGLLASLTLVALYERLRPTDPTLALWGLLIGLAGTLGSALHGGYDLANALHPPASVNLDLPSQVDPRGLATFGLTGLGLLALAWLIIRAAAVRPGGLDTGTPTLHASLPLGLGYLGLLVAALFLILYLARLIVLSPGSPLILVPAVLAGFVASPAWYLWLGLALWRGRGR
jgi:hypothetical protein